MSSAKAKRSGESEDPPRRTKRPKITDWAGSELERFAVSESERRDEKLNPENLERILAQLEKAGAVVLEQVVARQHLDALNKRMAADWASRRDELSFNYSEGHLQLNPPRTKKLVFGDVVANPFVEQIARRYIGKEGGTAGTAALGLKWLNVGHRKPTPGQELEHQQLCEALAGKTEFTQQEWDGFNVTNLREDHFVKSGHDHFKPAAAGTGYLGAYSGNCNCSGSEDQPVHTDIGHKVEQLECRSLICNVPTVDVSEDNGAIELLLETHDKCGLAKGGWSSPTNRAQLPQGATGGWPEISPKHVDARRLCAPKSFVRVCTQAGDVLLRDRRLWHRGRANPSSSPRIMVSLTYFPGINGETDRPIGRLAFEDGCQPAFRASDFVGHLAYQASFDHLSAAMISPRSLTN